MKIIISGGGTGGHVYPAIAIANALKEKGIKDILFVGAIGKLEMEKVPNAGYEIEGLDIQGFHRTRKWRNILFPFRLIKSLLKARKIIDKFGPDVVVGVGGYASGPVLRIAQSKGISTVIQEQNSYPGITNKLLAKKANRIFVAYDKMDEFFDQRKMLVTGNPVRTDLLDLGDSRQAAYSHFDLDLSKRTIFLTGGSLGARAINMAVRAQTELIKEFKDIQLLWQVGKIYYEEYSKSELAQMSHVHILPFVDRMDLAYAAADLVVCRAGALTISELCLVAKPAILLPSPNVAEDHQTKNANALVTADAALMIKDDVASESMIPKAVDLLGDEERMTLLSENIRKLGRPDARDIIAETIIKIGRNEA